MQPYSLVKTMTNGAEIKIDGFARCFRCGLVTYDED